MKTENQMKQPFFAKFLEGQTNQNAKKSQDGTQHSNACKGEPIPDLDVTLKFPSDSDEGL